MFIYLFKSCTIDMILNLILLNVNSFSVDSVIAQALFKVIYYWKDFLINFGLTIVNVTVSLLKQI